MNQSTSDASSASSPSQKDPMDSASQSGEDTVGRNAPCPCGSGKKYKRCHGKVEKPKISPMNVKIEGVAPRSQALTQQMKAAGLDPGQVDPQAILNMQKMLQRMPRGQVQRMQALMQKAMAGKDVSKEAQELERMLPPEMLQQMQSLSGMMGTAPGESALEELEQAEAPEMSASEARRIVEEAVKAGKLSREQAESLLAGDVGASSESLQTEPADPEQKKSFWKKLTGR